MEPVNGASLANSSRGIPAIVSGKLLERLDFAQHQVDSNYGMRLSIVTQKQQ